jgi:hypothetical protein
MLRSRPSAWFPADSRQSHARRRANAGVLSAVGSGPVRRRTMVSVPYQWADLSAPGETRHGRIIPLPTGGRGARVTWGDQAQRSHDDVPGSLPARLQFPTFSGVIPVRDMPSHFGVGQITSCRRPLPGACFASA